MGSYSENQNFYLIDPDELVNVDSDLNYNWARADQRVKPLVEYQSTDELSITDSDLVKETGFKYYKTRSNSIWSCLNGVVSQDANAVVTSWTSTGVTFEAGYTSFDEGINKVGFCTRNGVAYWRGRVIATGKAELPLVSAINFLNVPASVLPVTSKYFFVPGGNATGNYQAFRVFIPSASDVDKRFEFIGYGGTSAGVDERYVSLNSVRYPLNI